MSLQPMFQKLELRFWNFVIPLMQNSPWVKRLIPWLYHGLTPRLNRVTVLVLGACILAGGSLGFLLGILSLLR